MKEHRKHVRLIWKSKIKVLSDQKIMTVVAGGMLKNITKGGLSFSAMEVLRTGVIYNFQVHDILEMPIHFKGKVIRSKSLESFFHYGVRIESIRLLDRIHLNQFLAARDMKLKVRFLVYSLLSGAVAAGVGHSLLGLSQGLSIAVIFLTTFVLMFFPPF